MQINNYYCVECNFMELKTIVCVGALCWQVAPVDLCPLHTVAVFVVLSVTNYWFMAAFFIMCTLMLRRRSLVHCHDSFNNMRSSCPIVSCWDAGSLELCLQHYGMFLVVQVVLEISIFFVHFFIFHSFIIFIIFLLLQILCFPV